jgi:hypothetical protein
MDWWKTLGDAFGRRNTPPQSALGSSGGRGGPNFPQDEPEPIDSPLIWGPEQWDAYLNAPTPPTPVEFPQETGGILDSLAAAGAELRSWPGQALEARSRVQSSEPVVAFNDAMEGIFGAIGQGLRSGAQAVGQEVFMPLLGRLAETPKGREVVEALANPESQQRFVSFMERTAEALESFGESSLMYELDNPSVLAAEALIASGLAQAPEVGSGAGGRPLLMDVASAEGLPGPLAFLSETLVVEHYPSMPPGVGAALGALTQAAGVFTRQFSGMLRRAAGSADELAETMGRVLPSAVGDAAGEVASAARLARQAAIPEPMRQVQSFMAKLDEVEARYVDNPAAVRQWAQPDAEPLFDSIPRLPDGTPAPKSPELPDGLTPAELRSYHSTRENAIRAHGGIENLEQAFLDAYARGNTRRGEPGDPGDWYPQQRVMNDIQDAAGDDVVGRALFEHLNDMHARASSRSQPRNQAVRAVFVWAHELLGAHPASMTTVPAGAGNMAHKSQAVQMGQGVTADSMLSMRGQPKNSAYTGSLSGNLNEIVADVHYYRTAMNDLFLSSEFPKRKRLPFEEANIGAYLAVRDLGMDVARKNNLVAGDLQQRVWGGNAQLTGVEGTVEGFDATAAGAFDAVMGYLARRAGIEASPMETLRMVMRGDPNIARALNETPYEAMARSGDDLDRLVRELDPEAARDLINRGIETGSVAGPADAMRFLSEPDIVRHLSTTARRLERLVIPPLERMAELNNLDPAHVESVRGILTRLGKGPAQEGIPHDRAQNAFLNLDARYATLRDRIAGGGFTFDTTTNRMPQAGEGVQGFAVSPYNELQRVYPVGVLDDDDSLAEAFASFFLTRWEFLAQPAHGLGGWENQGSLFLDVVVLPRLREAGERFGKMGRQMGMYNFGADPADAYVPFTTKRGKPRAWATGGTEVLEPPPGMTRAEWDQELIARARKRA